jgi:YD repeat-containing protein
MRSVNHRYGKLTVALIIIVTVLGGGITTAFAQAPRIIPPSPSAASLGQYGDYPVSNYTGVPSISIPLYTITSGELQLPITLSYHGSGIKVAQEASWVGLGWTLNAGGAITRQINGMDDFGAWGYPTTDPLPPLTELNKGVLVLDYGIAGTVPPPPTVFYFHPFYPESYAQCQRSDNRSLDTEPDMFYFNFFGYSGRMVVPKQPGPKLKATSIEQNNVQFVYDINTHEWEVTDGNGWKYFFHTVEVSRSAGSASPSSSPNVTPNGSQTADMTTAWYIDRAITPVGDEITFEYANTGRWLKSPIYFSQRSANLSTLKINNNEPGLGLSDTNGAGSYSASENMADEVYLTRINFNNGYVIFNRHPEDRKDRYKYNITPTVAPFLDSFMAYDKSGAVVKSVDFNYSYFRDDKINASDKENYLRLKLNDVQESYKKPNGSYSYVPPYKFTYNETPLPAKNSGSTDHWGYFNGVDNSNIKGYKFIDLPSLTVNQVITTSLPYYSPRINYINDGSNVKIFINGANRESNQNFAKAGMLSTIQYPTGGVTQFNFEMNDYWNYIDPQYDETEVLLQTNSAGTTEQNFTLTESAFVFLQFNLINNNYNGDPNNPNVMNNMTAVLEKTDGTDILQFIPSDSQMDGQPGGNNNVNQMVANVCVAIPPGSYRIKTLNGGYVYLSMTLEAKYATRVRTDKKKGGGLRIKSIDTYDNPGGVLLKRKKFNYEETNRSTGRLLSRIQNFYNETALLQKLLASSYSYYTPCCYIESITNPSTPPVAQIIITTAENIVSLGTSAQGNPIGYNFVTVSDENEDGQNLGKSIFRYKNYAEDVPAIFLPNIQQRIFSENGQLTEQEDYNGASQVVRRKLITYEQNMSAQVRAKGLMIYRSYNAWPLTPEAFPAYNMPPFAGMYDVYSEWWYPIQTLETVYDVTGGNGITTTATFEYSNAEHKLLTKTTQTTSSGQQLVITNQYAPDEPTGTSTSTATFEDMVEANIINPVIKREVKLDGSLVEGSINNYAVDLNGNIVPSTIQQLKTGTTTYETRAQFQKYDATGRLLEFINNDGVITSYIWCYNNDFPVVEGRNVDYNTLKSAVESAAGTTNLETFWSGFGYIDHTNTSWSNFNTVLRNNGSLQQAVITTFTYVPLVGITSRADQNGQATFYEYDDNKRLKSIRNAQGEIIKYHKYVYSNE